MSIGEIAGIISLLVIVILACFWLMIALGSRGDA